MIAACARISPHEVPAPLSLTLCGGRGNDEDEYAAIVRAARAAPWPIELTGRLDQKSLAQRYRTAEAFVLPSFFEGLPLVTIEALACGCKVVMTDLPGVRPWMEQNVPAAPVWWVRPPRMAGIDEPVADDLPAFEERLRTALVGALKAPHASCDVSALSWESACARVLGAVRTGGHA